MASPQEGALQRHADKRARLLEIALRVATKHGFGDGAIRRVMATASLSSAEFAEHFERPEDLWQVVANALSNELILMIEGTAGEFVDAAKRVGCGVHLYLREANENPVFAKFIAHQGLAVAGVASLVHEHLPAHISLGNHTARFGDATSESALDLIAGTTLSAVQRIADGRASAGHAENVTLVILKSLGVPALQARRLVRVGLPQLRAPGGSLLMRARALRDVQGA